VLGLHFYRPVEKIAIFTLCFGTLFKLFPVDARTVAPKLIHGQVYKHYLQYHAVILLPAQALTVKQVYVLG